MNLKRKTVISSLKSLLEKDIKPGIEKALKEITENGNNENVYESESFRLLRKKASLLASWFDGRHLYTQDAITICKSHFQNGILDKVVSILADFLRKKEPKISAKKGTLNFKFVSSISRNASHDFSEALQTVVYLSNCGLAKWPFNEVETINVAFILLYVISYGDLHSIPALFEKCVNPGIDLSHLNYRTLAKGFERIYQLDDFHFENPGFISLFLAKEENQEFKDFLFNQFKMKAIIDDKKWKIKKVRKTIETVEKFIKALRMVVPKSTDAESQIKRKNFLEEKVKSIFYAVSRIPFRDTSISIDPEIKELLRSYVEKYTDTRSTYPIRSHLIPWKPVITECYETICNHLKIELKGLTVVFNTELLKSHYENAAKKLYLELMNVLSEEEKIKADNNSSSQQFDEEKVKSKICEFVKWIACYRIVSAFEKELRMDSLPEFFTSDYWSVVPENIFSYSEFRTPDELTESLIKTIAVVDKTLSAIKQELRESNLTVKDVTSRIRKILKDKGTLEVIACDVIHRLKFAAKESTEKSFMTTIKKVLSREVARHYVKSSILVFILVEVCDLVKEICPEKTAEYKALVKKVLHTIQEQSNRLDDVYEVIFTEEVHDENSLKKIKGFYALLSVVEALKKELFAGMSYELQEHNLYITFESEIITSLVLAVINAKIVRTLKRKNITEEKIRKLHKLHISDGVPLPEEIENFRFEKLCFYFYELIADHEPETIEKKSESLTT